MGGPAMGQHLWWPGGQPGGDLRTADSRRRGGRRRAVLRDGAFLLLLATLQSMPTARYRPGFVAWTTSRANYECRRLPWQARFKARLRYLLHL